MTGFEPKLTGQALTDYLVKREALRRAALPSSASPVGLEATMASISDEVTADAIERLAIAAKP